MFQIEKVSEFESGFELSVLYSYPMRSAFAFVSGLKCGKRWHSDPISSVSDPNPSLGSKQRQGSTVGGDSSSKQAASRRKQDSRRQAAGAGAWTTFCILRSFIFCFTIKFWSSLKVIKIWLEFTSEKFVLYLSNWENRGKITKFR